MMDPSKYRAAVRYFYAAAADGYPGVREFSCHRDPSPDRRRERAELPCGWEKGDVLKIDVNGRAIPAEHLSWNWFENGSPPACRIALSDPPFVYGDNELGLTITGSADGVEGEIVVERLDCVIGASAKLGQ